MVTRLKIVAACVAAVAIGWGNLILIISSIWFFDIQDLAIIGQLFLAAVIVFISSMLLMKLAPTQHEWLYPLMLSLGCLFLALVATGEMHALMTWLVTSVISFLIGFMPLRYMPIFKNKALS
jgi:hypothetical protein